MFGQNKYKKNILSESKQQSARLRRHLYEDSPDDHHVNLRVWLQSPVFVQFVVVMCVVAINDQVLNLGRNACHFPNLCLDCCEGVHCTNLDCPAPSCRWLDHFDPHSARRGTD